jgi:hypothetical protein
VRAAANPVHDLDTVPEVTEPVTPAPTPASVAPHVAKAVAQDDDDLDLDADDDDAEAVVSSLSLMHSLPRSFRPLFVLRLSCGLICQSLVGTEG